MKRLFIVHGWGGSPEEGWFPWLKKEAEKKGFKVLAPAFPDTEHPRIQEWVETLASVVGKADHETYFVGHSIGCQAILRYAETLEDPIGGAVFVAGWFDLDNLEDDDAREIAAPWVTTPVDLAKVKRVLSKSFLVISENDPFGAFEKNKKGFTKLGSEIIVIPEGGHFSGDDGYTELPIVLESLLTISEQR